MVPNNWEITQVGDLAKFSSGGTPSKKNPSFWGGDEPWISGKDLKSHYIERSIDTLTKEGFSIAKKAPKGASLILVRGMTLLKDFPVGYAIREVSFNQDLKALVPNSHVDGLFLSFLLVGNKNKIKQLVSTAGHGTGRLDTDSIKEYPVNLPPLSEQRKIAKILSTWDKAITTTELLLANSQQQKKALMQQLLTSKKRLVSDTGERFNGKWEDKELSDICTINPKKQNSPKDGKISFIPMNAVSEEAKIITLEERDYKEVEKGFTSFKDNDVLIAKITPCFENGKGGYAENLKNGIGFGSTEFHVLRAKENTCSKFIYYVVNTKDFRVRGEMNMQGSAGQKRVTKDYLSLYTLKLPASIEEQHKIAAVLSVADREIETLQQKITALKQEKQALMQQLLTGKRRVIVDDIAAKG